MTFSTPNKITLINQFLQISTPTRCLIFDLHALSGVGLRGNKTKLDKKERDDLKILSGNMLRDLFTADDIVKVGWGFSENDFTMLNRSGGGECV